MSKLRVAIIAPPWLKVPPNGYGGIEVVLDGLISGLRKQDITFELFTVGATKIRGVKTHSLYDEEQYTHIHKPIYDSLPIISAHMQFALNAIKEDGGFDVIHSHNGILGPQLLSWATCDKTMPPVVHTNHGPPFSDIDCPKDSPSNRPFWQQFANSCSRVYIVGISHELMRPAPKKLKKCILPIVYNAVEINKFKFSKKKKNYYYTLGRFSKDKGYDIAAKLCTKLGYELHMAGSVAGITSTSQLSLELANPMSTYRNTADFRYYSDEILPYLIKNKKIKHLGDVGGLKKQMIMANAKALLFPIQWNEPFGMVVIEAMACGTPVVAMNRGAMSEIIEHGVNGFLANSEEEFEEYMQRVDEIDPDDCRRSVEEKFSADTMAAQYVERYKEAVRLAPKKPIKKRKTKN